MFYSFHGKPSVREMKALLSEEKREQAFFYRKKETRSQRRYGGERGIPLFALFRYGKFRQKT